MRTLEPFESAALDAIVRPLREGDPDRVRQRRRHLHARVPPCGAFDDDEAFRVDLAAQRLTVTFEGNVVTTARAQLIGTLAPDETFLFGWHNSSIDDAGTALLAPDAYALDALRPLATISESFPCEAAETELLAEWIAVATGGCAWAAHVGDTVAWLRLDRFQMGDDGAETEAMPSCGWCSGCGRARLRAKRLVSGDHGAICERCTEALVAIRDDGTTLPPDLEAEPVDTSMPPCILTSAYTPRVYMRYVAVSWSALAQVETLLREAGVLG